MLKKFDENSENEIQPPDQFFKQSYRFHRHGISLEASGVYRFFTRNSPALAEVSVSNSFPVPLFFFLKSIVNEKPSLLFPKVLYRFSGETSSIAIYSVTGRKS